MSGANRPARGSQNELDTKKAEKAAKKAARRDAAAAKRAQREAAGATDAEKSAGRGAAAAQEARRRGAGRDSDVAAAVNERRQRRIEARQLRRDLRRERRRARWVRRIIWPAAALLGVGLFLLLFTNIFGFQLIPGLPQISLVQRETFASSTITLESVRELSRFDTVRYVHRAVFPYDYLPDGVSLNTVFDKLRGSTGTVREALTENEYQFFTAYNLAADIGLPVSAGAFDFVVVTLVISAGVDLQDEAMSVSIEETAGDDGETTTRATLPLPPASINRIDVEDINPEDYPFPDTSVSADGWRRIADYVRSQPLPDAVTTRALAAAEEGAARFLESVLLQAGIDEVVLTAPVVVPESNE